MGLLCFKNGSLTRERIRNVCAHSSWSEFSTILESTPRGNEGNIGIYFDIPEITPNAVGVFRFDGSNTPVSSFSAAVEVRAVIEGQFLSRRFHAENLGYSLGRTGRVLATGGASNNQQILQVLADVFNTPVYVQNVADSACLGSAYRAKHGFLGGGDAVAFHDVVAGAQQDLTCAAMPNVDASQIYDSLVARYAILEQQVASAQCSAS
jgi:xylulokinase